MANSAFNQFGLVFTVTILAEGMGGILKRINLIRHADLAVVAGFTFFNFLAVVVRNSFAVGAFAVMAGLALESCLMRAMGKGCWLGGLGRIKGRIEHDFCGTFFGRNSRTAKADQAGSQQQ